MMLRAHIIDVWWRNTECTNTTVLVIAILAIDCFGDIYPLQWVNLGQKRVLLSGSLQYLYCVVSRTYLAVTGIHIKGGRESGN